MRDETVDRSEEWGCPGTKKARRNILGGPDSGIGSETLFLRLGFAEADDALAFLPLTALLEQLDALEAFEDIPLDLETAGGLETRML
jgi:hypothetical protein